MSDYKKYIEQLGSPDEVVQDMAVAYLGDLLEFHNIPKHEHQEITDALVNQLRNCSSDTVTDSILSSLWYSSGRNLDLSTLFEFLPGKMTGFNDYCLSQSIYLLGTSGKKEFVELLRPYKNHHSYWVKEAAEEATIEIANT
ncbi:hypothetical protein ACJJI3_22890 [Microbulbifer sp. ZKSA004]|uniref:hypothetical protein n=1 Tax=Microbulbifer sp. ZKSA004 TaxID=3243389 RepID=UPI00403920A8